MSNTESNIGFEISGDSTLALVFSLLEYLEQCRSAGNLEYLNLPA